MPVSKNEMTNPHEERVGTTMSEDIRVACCLSDAELRKRVATLLARFESAVIATEELPDGYVFRVPGDKKWMGVVWEAIVSERECCPFFDIRSDPPTEYGTGERPRDWTRWYQGLLESDLMQFRGVPLIL
jgi:hypothetical protein